MSQATPPFNSLKLKLWLRRMSISSPRAKIKPQLPWPMRLISLAVVVGLGGGIALWTYDVGMGLAGMASDDTRSQLARYKREAHRLAVELEQYSTTANAAESQLNIERSAQRQLSAQIRNLEVENVRLKEDLAFFESLLPNATGPLGISIRRLKVDSVMPGQLRYRLLIMQGGRGGRDFVGSLQLAVTVLQDGKDAMIVFPEAISSNEPDKFKLRFKHYQRVEGVLTLPEDAVVKMVQARVLESGQIRAQQSANL